MSKPTLYGPGFSTYVRSIRIALAEKGVDYDLEEFNFLEGWPDGYEKRHPFMKVPAFAHDGFDLYETPPILRYVDEAFEGPALQPAGVVNRAEMERVISIIDNYAYSALITRTFIPRAVIPMLGGETDESVIEGAKQEAGRAVSVLNTLIGGSGFFAGDSCTLADIHTLPVIHYAAQIPDGQALLSKAPALSNWLTMMNERSSVSSTVPQLG